MLNNVLNIIGGLLIIYSIYIIKKDINRNNNLVEELSSIEKNTKQYYKHTESIVTSFDKLVELKLDKINDEDSFIKTPHTYTETGHIKIEEKPDEVKLKVSNINKDNIKIIELLDLGLTKEEIARKLNKGIREVDIIIKMYKKNS